MKVINDSDYEAAIMIDGRTYSLKRGDTLILGQPEPWEDHNFLTRDELFHALQVLSGKPYFGRRPLWEWRGWTSTRTEDWATPEEIKARMRLRKEKPEPSLTAQPLSE